MRIWAEQFNIQCRPRCPLALSMFDVSLVSHLFAYIQHPLPDNLYELQVLAGGVRGDNFDQYSEIGLKSPFKHSVSVPHIPESNQSQLCSKWIMFHFSKHRGIYCIRRMHSTSYRITVMTKDTSCFWNVFNHCFPTFNNQISTELQKWK